MRGSSQIIGLDSPARRYTAAHVTMATETAGRSDHPTCPTRPDRRALLTTGETLIVPGADRIGSPLLHGFLFSSMSPATFPVLERLEKERRNHQHRL
ncbi:MAG: hypothetical protein WKF86_01640 [Acidimicrobiales bacterium]